MFLLFALVLDIRAGRETFCGKEDDHSRGDLHHHPSWVCFGEVAPLFSTLTAPNFLLPPPLFSLICQWHDRMDTVVYKERADDGKGN